MYTRKEMAYNAKDSTSIVMIVSYNPPTLFEGPMAFRMALACRTSRMMIISIKITLRASEIAKYEVSRAITELLSTNGARRSS